MKQITNKTILIQEIGQEKCKEYGCGNSECIFECLNPKKIFKTYQPVEVDGVIYWGKKSNEDWFNFYNEDEYWFLVAQSQPKLEGIPVISLDSYVERLGQKYGKSRVEVSTAWGSFVDGYKSNPNQYNQKDIEKAIELARETISSNEAGICDKYTELGILQQINSISVIEVDEQFNIISYE